MNAASMCHILVLLMIIVFLMVITSFVFIDSHIAGESLRAQAGVYDVSNKLFHLHRSRTSVVDPAFDKPHAVVVATELQGDLDNIKVTPIANTNSATVEPPGKSCSVSFPPKCRMNPLVKYWDEVTECYTSPLRALNGKQCCCSYRNSMAL